MDYVFEASALSVLGSSTGLGVFDVAYRRAVFEASLLSAVAALADVEIKGGYLLAFESLVCTPSLLSVTIEPGASVWATSSLVAPPTFSRVSFGYLQFYEIPGVFPSTREFEPPAHYVTQARTQSGSIVQRVWASRPGGGRLRLGFQNIPDSDAEKLAAMWDRAKGRRLSIVLPSRLFRGMEPELRAHMELSGLPLTWAFARQPAPRSEIPGISSVDLEFVGRGYGGQALPVLTVPDPPRELFIAPITPLLITWAVGFLAARIARIGRIEMQATLQELFLNRHRHYTASSLVRPPSLPGANVLFGRVFSISRVQAPPTLQPMNLLANRITYLQPLTGTPTLPTVNVVAGRIYQASTVSVATTVGSVEIRRLRWAAVNALQITTSLRPVVFLQPGEQRYGYYATWQGQNAMWLPDFYPDWWTN